MAKTNNNKSEYVKLEQRLILLSWFNQLFGYSSNKEMLSDIQETAEGCDSTGRSYIYHHLIARGGKVQLSPSALSRYDDNICEHLRAMNALRPEPITLRYFQYLAVLYTEIYLEAYFNRRNQLLFQLNSYVAEQNQKKPAGVAHDEKFSEADLRKLAYWMATGSGKTLIMHLNYRQFLHYNTTVLDNVLLITPNEGLSEQHIEEMTASNIPCRRFDLNESGLDMTVPNTVRVIEITKLVEDKKGGGLSVPVEAFEGNNLILVDEGHKGSSSTKNEKGWRYLRNLLDQTGFTFEYSATFGQALSASHNDELTAEYGKAIIFDYSYKYFHSDGFGKDFRILNLQEETTEDKTAALLLGNLLSFYQQKRVFEDSGKELQQYNIEKPLWVFVGSSVNAVYTENKRKRSDVLTVARFLHHVLENKRNWVEKAIRTLLEARTGLNDPTTEQDIFTGKFPYLLQSQLTAEEIYQDILRKVLRTHAGGGLHISDLRGQTGELALKASGSEEYFGLIYIGDTSNFKNLVESDDSGIIVEEDAIVESLFDRINEPDTSVEILIGAKKFMEGWNSWRVSNMGLLNIGKKEGSEIIQLFGRGVRLQGKHLSLKRSSALDGQHPDYISVLETLNIFAVKANYMSKFREYLEKEGIETEGDVELPLPIKPNYDFLVQGLVVPRVPNSRNFANETDILLRVDSSIQVNVDMSLKVQAMESSATGITATAVKTGGSKPIPQESLKYVDWENIYLELLDYKERKGMFNLAIKPNTPREIISQPDSSLLYNLIADDSIKKPNSFKDTAILNEAVLNILQKYMDTFYRKKQEKWDSEHMIYQGLEVKDANFPDYTVKIARSETQLITDVEKLIKKADTIYKQDLNDLPTVHFDRHLYQPLLIEQSDKIRSEPPGLKDSELKFVKDLREFFQQEKEASLTGKEIYLLRNLSRGKGVGFFEKRGFYPDFILWIKENDTQRIVFVEPHGMLFADAYQHDEKAKLHEILPTLGKEMAKRSGIEGVTLDSYIISATSFNDLQTKYEDGSWDRQRFSEAHILFPERTPEYDYINTIIKE